MSVEVLLLILISFRAIFIGLVVFFLLLLVQFAYSVP